LKNIQISNFIKIPAVGAELFYAKGQTDRQTDGYEEANSFPNIANEPKNGYVTILVNHTLRCNSALFSHQLQVDRRKYR
jgi:hypothetical protein